jgi:hypothetical protein
MFNADYRLKAVSGNGVVKNTIGFIGPIIPKLFTRYIDNSKEDSCKIYDKYLQDVLFLFIGISDENNFNPSTNTFVSGYMSML